MIRLAMLGTVVVAAGCGLVPDQASCDSRPQAQACTDLLDNKNNQASTTLDALCTGTFSADELCDTTGALGGCRCDGCENGQNIEWLFPDPSKNINTAADVMAACLPNRVFVTP